MLQQQQCRFVHKQLRRALPQPEGAVQRFATTAVLKLNTHQHLLHCMCLPHSAPLLATLLAVQNFHRQQTCSLSLLQTCTDLRTCCGSRAKCGAVLACAGVQQTTPCQELHKQAHFTKAQRNIMLTHVSRPVPTTMPWHNLSTECRQCCAVQCVLGIRKEQTTPAHEISADL